MATKWISATKGVRYREHETRKHNKRPDRYYVLQYKHRGKVYNEPLGWASDGITQAICEAELAKLKENWRTGESYQTLREKKELNEEKAIKAKEQKAHEQTLTLPYIFEYYLSVQSEKTEKSINAEKQLMKNHVLPFFGDTSIISIDTVMMDKFLNVLKEKKSEKTGKNLSASTIRYAIAVLRQIWNYALTRKIVKEAFPLVAKQPRQDNKRTGFLTYEQAELLLEKLLMHSKDVHDMALLSLYCGLRQGEIFKLQWGDIDFRHELINVRDRKNKESGVAYISSKVNEMLKSRYDGQTQNAYIFGNDDGTEKNFMSKTFDRVVTELGFNDGVEDRRKKIVFHSLRHTYASWLAQQGVSMFDLAELLGHKDIQMTQRYSHHNPDKLKKSAMLIEKRLPKAKTIQFDNVNEG